MALNMRVNKRGSEVSTRRPRTSRRFRIGWRAVVTVLIFGALLRGTIWGTDMAFPFGPLTQYAFRTDPNGVIESNYVDADTTEGKRIHIPMAHSGMSRAQLEGQLWKFVQDPSMLQQLAKTQRERYPNDPHYVRLYLMRDTVVLKNAAEDRRFTQTLSQWEVK